MYEHECSLKSEVETMIWIINSIKIGQMFLTAAEDSISVQYILGGLQYASCWELYYLRLCIDGERTRYSRILLELLL